jgi:hypothetical protein
MTLDDLVMLIKTWKGFIQRYRDYKFVIHVLDSRTHEHASHLFPNATINFTSSTIEMYDLKPDTVSYLFRGNVLDKSEIDFGPITSRTISMKQRMEHGSSNQITSMLFWLMKSTLKIFAIHRSAIIIKRS